VPSPPRMPHHRGILECGHLILVHERIVAGLASVRSSFDLKEPEVVPFDALGYCSLPYAREVARRRT
jgi:hypothetical protein